MLFTTTHSASAGAVASLSHSIQTMLRWKRPRGIFIAVRLILDGLSHSPAVMADKGLSEKAPSNKDGQLSRGRAAAYVLINA